MSLLGRLRAALGRDDASLMARARGDVRMGLGLNPPASLAPLNRAIASLERLPASPEVSLLLGKALRAKAQALSGKPALIFRARAVAKLRAMVDSPRLGAVDRAALWAALAQAWLPLPQDAKNPDLTYRQLIRAQEAQSEALVIPTAAAHLAMAEIALALCQSALCPDSRAMAGTALSHIQHGRNFLPDADESGSLDALESAVRHLFPGLSARETP